jgi:predicted transcriptional regulator
MIPPDLDARLKAVWKETGVPMSEIARRAIVEYLDRHEAQQRREVVTCGEPGSR